MANYDVAADEVGTYQKQLVADAIDKVTIDRDCERVEVFADGSAAVYFTVDKTNPTVEGGHCYEIPAIAAARTVVVPTAGNTEVRLISAGTPKYSVSEDKG